MRTHLQIAIDGPAGVGKSTIGELLARRLGYLYVDTGALYRTLTALALKTGTPLDNAQALDALARNVHIEIVAPTAATRQDGGQYTVLVGGADVTGELRTPAVDAAVSSVSNHEVVRATLIERMREMANQQGVVMVGRDIGTIVLPNADLKIFLTTSIEERAKRRHGDLVAKYGATSPALETVRDEIIQRDAKDAAHTYIAADALVLNNDHLEAYQVVERIMQIIEERWQGEQRP